MKIITPSGIIIELADGETIPSGFMERMMGNGSPATVTRHHWSAEPPTPDHLPFEGLIKETAPTPSRRRPSKCYLTTIEFRAMGVMLDHPDGLTTERLAEILGVTHSAASSTLHRIRTNRPYKDTTEPLVVVVSKHIHKVTKLGARLTYAIADGRSSPRKNRNLGWGA
jgi:hypothetical protein